MASYQGHLSFSTLLGAAYGGYGALHLQLDWGPVFLGFGLTALGGLLPDLDSDSGVPVRELFGLAAAAAPFLLLERLRMSEFHFTTEQILVLLGGAYLFIRYGLSGVFKRLTVHRGMFHSIPAMLIAGLVVFLLHRADLVVRVYLAGGTVIGFLSHLVLDELYSIDFMGKTFRPNKYAGSALKLASASAFATVFTYALLALLAWVAYLSLEPPP